MKDQFQKLGNVNAQLLSNKFVLKVEKLTLMLVLLIASKKLFFTKDHVIKHVLSHTHVQENVISKNTENMELESIVVLMIKFVLENNNVKEQIIDVHSLV